VNFFKRYFYLENRWWNNIDFWISQKPTFHQL